MTHLWPEGVAIDVVPDALGRPARFTWRRQSHAVAHVALFWRVDLDWWRRRVWRDYYRLSTDTGLLVVVFQDLAAGGWFLERLYD